MSETRSDWSKLCPDLLRSIFGRLIISKDFYRSRTVCSDWYSVSTTCVPTAYPWRILLDEDSTLLFDPGEDNIYEIGHPELDLLKTHVMASCSNWLLVGRAGLNLYLQNVFTRERINLPECLRLAIENSSSCLWINERTRDYVVACSSKQGCLFSCKKGDVTWLCHERIECAYVTYKDGKLYVYTFDRCIEILDLSGDLLVQGNPYRNHPFHIDDSHPKSVVITSSGELLIVVTFKGVNNRYVNEVLNRSFNVYKMNLDNGNWERVYSIGGEMLIFGHGVTIKAPIKGINGWGIKGDTICFGGDEEDIFPSSDRRNRTTNCGVFDLATDTQTSLDVPFFKSFWFVPEYEIVDHETGFFFLV